MERCVSARACVGRHLGPLGRSTLGWASQPAPWAQCTAQPHPQSPAQQPAPPKAAPQRTGEVLDLGGLAHGAGDGRGAGAGADDDGAVGLNHNLLAASLQHLGAVAGGRRCGGWKAAGRGAVSVGARMGARAGGRVARGSGTLVCTVREEPRCMGWHARGGGWRHASRWGLPIHHARACVKLGAVPAVGAAP